MQSAGPRGVFASVAQLDGTPFVVDGTRVHRFGHVPASEDVSGTTSAFTLRDIAASGNRLWAVGTNGAVFERDGEWNAVPTDTHGDLLAVAAGDSIVVDAGPYSSPIRKNVQTTIHGIWRLQGDSLGGPVTAHYTVKTADSVRVFRAMGTRAP